MEFGAHMSSSGGIDTAIDRIVAVGGDCVQVFTQSPRMWRPTNHKPEAIQAFHDKRAEHGIGVAKARWLQRARGPAFVHQLRRAVPVLTQDGARTRGSRTHRGNSCSRCVASTA